MRDWGSAVGRYPAKKEYIRSNKTDDFPCLKIELKTVDTGATLTVDTLLDSGATGLYVDSEFIHKNGLTMCKLAWAIPVYNVDGMLNEGGVIKETIDFIMCIKGHTEHAVTDLLFFSFSFLLTSVS